MDDTRLGSFRPDPDRIPDDTGSSSEDIPASLYHQEANTLKIEKLSNRVTIISVIIPCIIIAIVAFVYLDMKEQVVDVGETRGNEVATLARTTEEKLNALDVRIAEIKYQMDEALPKLSEASKALGNQLAKLDSDLKKIGSQTEALASQKNDRKTFDAAVVRLEKKIKANTGQDKTAMDAMERINQDLLASINKNNAQFKSRADQIKDEMKLFKEEFDARLMELSAYEQQIAQLQKALSLMDKKFKTFRKETEDQSEKRLDQVRLTLEQKILDLEGRIKHESKPSAAKAATPAPKPGVKAPATPSIPSEAPSQPAELQPQLDESTGISQETLTQ